MRHAACPARHPSPAPGADRHRKVDAEAATIIQSHLFDFEDLIRLRSQELQLLLGRVDNATLARSLVDADEVVAQRLFANASDRRATAAGRDGTLRRADTGRGRAGAQRHHGDGAHAL